MRLFDEQYVPAPDLAPERLPDFRQPVDLEIGGGAGLFAVRFAESYPMRQLISIERNQQRYNRLVGRLASNQNCEKIFPIRSDAVSWITHSLADASIERCFLLYPNPYPKHRNRRWAAMPFMECLLRKLKPKGTIHIASNELFYMEEAKDLFFHTWGLQILNFQKVSPQRRPRSHFEKKFLFAGEDCYELVVAKR